MRALSGDWFAHHRERMACWHHDRLDEALHDIRRMEAEITELQQELAQQRSTTPATVTITARDKDGTMTDTYAPGATIYLTATVTNAEGTPLTGIAGTWATDQGTITQNPNNPQEATLVNAPVGQFNVTFTTTGDTVVGSSYPGTVADQAPATVTITGSTTPPADETPASA